MSQNQDNILNKNSQGYLAVHRLAREHPEWIPIVRACLREAKRVKGDFAGAWVLEEAKKEGVRWFPNLRILVSYGILQRTYVTRAGRRAYYVMPDISGVERALSELKNIKTCKTF